jgi:hypothetical protein
MPPLTSSEWVAPSTPEVQIPQEVQEVGVEAQPTIHPVPGDAQAAGVQLAKEAVPVQPVAATTVDINTPRSLIDSLKKAHHSVKDAFRWMLEVVSLAQDKKAREEEKGGAI